MLKRIKKLLTGPLPTVEKIDQTAGTIDIVKLEAAFVAATQRRSAILLDGSIDQILAAERVVDTARIELERGQAALAELGRRREEAQEKASREELEGRRADAQALVDAAVARIEKEYPVHAAAIAELAALAHEADAAAGEWYGSYIAGDTHELGMIDPVAKRLGWHEKFFSAPLFQDGPSLPSVGKFPGYGAAAKWASPTEMYAVYGSGRAPNAAQAL